MIFIKFSTNVNDYFLLKLFFILFLCYLRLYTFIYIVKPLAAAINDNLYYLYINCK